MARSEGKHRWRVLAVVSAAVFMASLDLFIVNIAFPDIQRDFPDETLSGLSWILNAYAIVFAALLVPAGRSADRLGRRRGFLAGLVLFTVASALCALAPSVPLLVAARVLQAVGGAAIIPTSLALILAEFPASQRRPAVAAWAAVGGVAAAAGPPVGGLLVQGGWQLVFLVNVPIGIVVLFVAARMLTESREAAGAPRPDLAGAVLLTAAIATLTLAIVKAPDWGWGDGRTVALLAAAVILTVLLVARSRSHPVPVVEPDLLRERRFAAANLASLLFFMAFGAMLLSSVLFLTDVWGRSVLRAGLEIAPGPAMAAFFSVPAGQLSQRYGERVVGTVGALLFGLGGVWWIARVGLQPDYAGDFLPAMLVGGAGVGLVIPSIFSAAAAALPPERFATGTAVTSMSRQIGTVLGVAALVAVLGTPSPANVLDRFDSGWAVLVAASVGAAVAFAVSGGSGSKASASAAEPAEALSAR